MKKFNLMFLIPCLLGTTNVIVNASESNVSLSEEVVTNLANSFKSKFEITTDISFNYEESLPPLTIIDQFDAKNRINIITYKKDILQEVYLSSDEKGNVVEQFLTVSNTVGERYVTNSNGGYINFLANYGSPFTCFINLTPTKVNSYFDVTENEETYTLKAKKMGYGVITNLILNFYTDFDTFVWDNSVSEYIDNYILEISKDGTPLSYSFDKVKKDIYGGIKESYSADLKIIETVDVLKPYSTTLVEETAEYFKTNMDNFQTLLDQGNFTQTITFESEAFVEPITYSNYFALNGTDNFIGSMICSYPLEESTKGETYVCILDEGTAEPSYASYGISPSSDYFSNLTSENYTSIEEIVPRLGDISADFFTYNSYNRTYKFNFSSFIHGDSYFYGTLLTSLFGISDPFVQYVGFYLDNYSYNFNSLTIGFDDFGYPYGSLEYNYSSYVITSSFTFSNIGTTDLINCSDVSLPLEYIINNVL